MEARTSPVRVAARHPGPGHNNSSRHPGPGCQRTPRTTNDRCHQFEPQHSGHRGNHDTFVYILRKADPCRATRRHRLQSEAGIPTHATTRGASAFFLLSRRGTSPELVSEHQHGIFRALLIRRSHIAASSLSKKDEFFGAEDAGAFGWIFQSASPLVNAELCSNENRPTTARNAGTLICPTFICISFCCSLCR